MKKLMKVFAVFGIIIGLASVGANVFAYVEKIPSYERFVQKAADPSMPEASLYGMMLSNAGEHVRTISYIALGAGILAVVLSGLSLIKVKKGWAATGLILGLIGAGGQFAWAHKGEQHLTPATKEEYIASQKEAVEIIKKHAADCLTMERALVEHAKKVTIPNRAFMKENKGTAAFKDFKDKEIWPLLEESLPLIGKCRDHSPMSDIVRIYEHILLIKLTKD